MYITFTIVLVSCVCTRAQVSASSQEAGPAAEAVSKAIDITAAGIQIGEKVPDVTITNIYNYKTETAKLSDFKGKLLILDFWATWCGACIAMIPKMDSLQKVFGDKVQFLSVTYQKEKLVLPFLDKFGKQHGRKYGLPVVVADTTLRRLFPNKSLPHYVWIDNQGKVQSITEADAVTFDNINQAVSGTFSIKQKKDYYQAFDQEKPFLINGNGGDGSKMIYHSVLTGYVAGLTGGNRITKTDSTKERKINLRNTPLRKFFATAFRDQGYFSPNRVVLDVRDSSRFIRLNKDESYTEWLKRGNGFCYELIVPPNMSRKIFQFMQDDCRRFFPQYKTLVEKRKVKCYALIRTNNLEAYLTAGGTSSIKANRFSCTIRNSSLSSFLLQLNVLYLQDSPLPLVDATGLTTNVDMDINCSLADFGKLNNELEKYGLQFIETERELKVLLIKDSEELKFNGISGL